MNVCLMFIRARIYLNCIDNVDRQISGTCRNESIPSYSKPNKQCFLHWKFPEEQLFFSPIMISIYNFPLKVSQSNFFKKLNKDFY